MIRYSRTAPVVRLSSSRLGQCEWLAATIATRAGMRGGAAVHPTIQRPGERSAVVLPLGHRGPTD